EGDVVRSSGFVDQWICGLVRVSQAVNETTRTAQTSSPFSPTLFSGGEGGRRPDEGAVANQALENSSPLIRLRHLLPPQKARGEKALDGWAAREGLRTSQKCSVAILNLEVLFTLNLKFPKVLFH